MILDGPGPCLCCTAADDPQDSDFDPTDGGSSRGGRHVSLSLYTILNLLYALLI